MTAQDTFFPIKEGTILTYSTYNSQGKELNTMSNTVSKVSVNDRNMDIVYINEVFSSGKKPKSIYKKEVAINQSDDKLYFDMNDYAYMESLTNILPGTSISLGGNTASSSQKVGRGGTVTASVSMPEKDVTIKKRNYLIMQQPPEKK